MSSKTTDWYLLGLGATGVFIIPIALYSYGFSQSGYYLQPSLNLATMVLVAMVCEILLAIFMMVIFLRDANNYTNKSFTQTIIFGISLIPMILMMSWIISILCPQIVYWATEKYSWNKKIKNLQHKSEISSFKAEINTKESKEIDEKEENQIDETEDFDTWLNKRLKKLKEEE